MPPRTESIEDRADDLVSYQRQRRITNLFQGLQVWVVQFKGWLGWLNADETAWQIWNLTRNQQ